MVRQVATRGRGVCETSKGKVLNIQYKVAQLGRRMVMLIMEIQSAKGPRPIGGLNSRRPAPSPRPGRHARAERTLIGWRGQLVRSGIF